MYSFSIRQFIWEYIGDFYDSWMFGPNFILMLLMFGGRGGVYLYDVDIRSCTRTPTPKLIVRVATRAGEKKNFVAQKEIDGVFICSWGFYTGFQFS